MINEELKYRISLEDYFSKGMQGASEHARAFDHHVVAIREHISSLTERAVQAFGIFETFEFGKDAFKAFVDGQKQAQMLSFAVSARGGLGKDFRELKEQAEGLEKTGIFDIVQTEKAQRELLNYGISIKQVKSSMQGLQSAAAQGFGGNLDEVIAAAARASAGGRKMALLPLGLGFLKLEKDMSVAGAEARNFQRILDAVNQKYSGGMAAFLETDAGRVMKLKNEFEAVKRQFGEEIAGAFNSLLPAINSIIHSMSSLATFIRDNSNLLIGLAKAATTAFLVFKGMEMAVGVFKALKFALMDLSAWFQIVTAAETTMSEALMVTPWGAVAAGIGVVVAGLFALKGASDDAAAAQKRLHEQENATIFKEEDDHIEGLIDQYIKLHKVKEGVARQAVIDSEIQRNFDATNLAIKATTNSPYNLDTKNQNAKNLQELGDHLKGLKKELERAKTRGYGGSENDLGSGLKEPKASRIQNITFNLNQPFQNQKISMTGGVDDVKNIAPLFTEFLLSLVEDASIVATE